MANDSLKKLIAEIESCRRCPRLGRVARAGRGRPSQAVRRPALLGQAGTGLRRPRGASGGRGVGSGRPWRQSNRSHLHRRPLRRLAVRGAAPRRLRQPGGVGRPRRRLEAERCLGDGDRPLRAAGQPPDDRGARCLHPLLRARAVAVEGKARAAGARRLRLGRHPQGAADARRRDSRDPNRVSATESRSRSVPTRCSAVSTSASRTPSPGG